MAFVSGKSAAFVTPHASHFLRAATEMTRYRPHLNPCTGSDSYQRKKRAGERPIRYEEVVGFLVNARKDGARKGLGAEMVTVLINSIIRDTLPDDAPLDVVARPADDLSAPVASRREEELEACVAVAKLIATAEDVLADGHITVTEERKLEAGLKNATRSVTRFVHAVHREGRRA